MFGRDKEKKELLRLVNSQKSELVAVYGRRRIGKTFLIRESFQNQFTFYTTGIANVDMKTQLGGFYKSIVRYSNQPLDMPTSWFDAFDCLKLIIEQTSDSRKIIFIDEFPWMDSPKSKFLSAFEHFWNGWASQRKDIVLVICGSATSYIVNKILASKGGLHNRVTSKIKLGPFTLGETKSFLQSKNIAWTDFQIIQIYMILGGVPFYLDAIQSGKSPEQSIDDLLFNKEGLLSKEFDFLYASLFSNPEKYVEIIEVLASKKKGLTRNELAAKIETSNGGTLTKMLMELELSDFIRKYTPVNNLKRDSLYQLNDFYSLFYYNFIHSANVKAGDWIASIDNPKQRAWSGYAFEQVCLSHINQIKNGLGISGVYTTESAWRSKSTENGAQIDLVLERRDRITHLFELKFSINEFTITKKYESELRNKLGAFREETKTKNAVWLAMLTTFGVKDNEYKNILQNELTMDCLFT